MDDDERLLRQFAKEGSQEAFAALTKRYLGLVYSVCRRELDSNESAEDATQAVFLLLARKAKTLRVGPSLAGWLFQTARFVARNARTQAARRTHYEGKAAAMQSPTEDSAAWADIEPLLNQSLAALPARDREGVLLRFFQGMTFAEMGAVLGLSEEAARKRVGRALEKLRRSFDREGVTLPSAVLPALLSAHALRPVPDHLAGAVTATLAGAVPAKVALITQGITHSMKLLKLKLAAGAAALLIAGSATYAVAQTGHAKPRQDTKLSLDESANASATGPTPAAPGATQAVTLRYKFAPGQVRRYKITNTATGTVLSDQSDPNTSTKQTMEMVMRQTVQSVRSTDGAATLSTQIESIQSVINGQKTQLSEDQQALLKKPSMQVMLPNGKMLSSAIPQSASTAMPGMTDVPGQSVVFPAGPLSTGDTWKATVNVPGVSEMKMELLLSGLTGSGDATVANVTQKFNGTVGMKTSEGVTMVGAASGTGSLAFNTAQGTLDRQTTDSDSNLTMTPTPGDPATQDMPAGMKIRMHQHVVMERLPDAAAK